MITDHFPMLNGLILDMDGVLWHDDQPIGDLPAIFGQIKNLGLDFVLATNNSAKTVDEYQDKLSGFGLQIEARQILTSAVASFHYLKKTHPDKRLVHIVGSDSLKADAFNKGFTVLMEGDKRQADVVIVGLDRNLTYAKIDYASRQIRNGAVYVATNTDATYPTPSGPIPGAGTMVAAIQTASGQTPVVIGKPSPSIYHQAIEVMGLQPHQVLCVGDRLETDIVGAQQGGFASALLLSGVSTKADLDNWEPNPDLVAENLEEMING